LSNSEKIAETESEILDILAKKEELSPIELRAARSSLQILTENCIGKAKRILKHYNCPTVPRTGRDAVHFLYELGLIEDEMYRELSAAIGFRNAMVHDYMAFDERVLIEILQRKRYRVLAEFLCWTPQPTEIERKRIENYLL
jgi:uncharacterized protein YutE (UPF0331/DUF86 family)